MTYAANRYYTPLIVYGPPKKPVCKAIVELLIREKEEVGTPVCDDESAVGGGDSCGERHCAAPAV